MSTGNIIFPCISWERSSLTSCPRKKYHAFAKKNTIFPDNTKKIMPIPARSFWKDHLFRKFQENIMFLCIFLITIIFIFRLRYKIREKDFWSWSFSIIQGRSYSSATVLERPSFQDVWNKKIWFSVQCGMKCVDSNVYSHEGFLNYFSDYKFWSVKTTWFLNKSRKKILKKLNLNT